MAPIPASQKAIRFHKTGGLEVLQIDSIPVPKLAKGEILVRNTYAGVNFIDNYYRIGLYKHELPMICGREGAGTIQAVGPGVTKFKEGDRVAYMHDGTFSEYSSLDPIHASVLPDGVSDEIGAASMINGMTALTLVKESYEVKKDDWILLHAAAGGMGLWLCQILSVLGAKIIGTASTAEKLKLAKEYGAQHLINYSEENVVQRVMELTNNQGVSCVYDGVGATTFESSFASLARKGKFVSFGNASGPPAPLTIQRLAAKNISICRPTLFGYIVTREEFESYATPLWEMISSGKVKVNVSKVYSMQEIATAMEDLSSRKTVGKLVVKLDS